MKNALALLTALFLISCASHSRKPASSDSPQDAKIAEIAEQIKTADVPGFGAYKNLDMKFNSEQTWKIASLGGDKPEYANGAFPHYTVSAIELVNGSLQKDAHETLTTRSGVADADFRRLLHPNGICLRGTWKIDAYPDPIYTGYFKPGTVAPIIARASTHGANTMVNTEHYNSFGFVGRIFRGETTETADFITQTDLGGVEAKSYFQSDALNTPSVSALHRKQSPLDIEVTKLLATGAAFAKNDSNTSNRQVYDIAELGKGDEPTKTPPFIKFAFSKMHKPFPNGPMDFRAEILQSMPFTVEIQVAEGPGKKTLLNGIKLDVNSRTWRRIGEVTFDSAVVSHACDFRINFHHSPWRDELNKPGTEKQSLRPH